MWNKVKILKIEKVAHDAKRITVERPEGYTFVNGEAALIGFADETVEKRKKSFTISSKSTDKNLRFLIRIYSERDGFTSKINALKKGDELIIGKPFGTIKYKGEGTFIAGGVGISPFLSILKGLEEKGDLTNNKVIYSNRTEKDIICREELEKMLGDNLILVLTRQKSNGSHYGRIDKSLLKKKITNLNQYFYVCGSDEFVKDVCKMLKSLDVSEEKIVVEGKR